ncbi:transglycosylase SLT domain-containing protein [Streptomyces klenkii]|uniref:transglycosylase SLT domain-containing protein n=1 Tax=Streptomyces klenkii TaxID=1420899 RepID=UPI0034180B1E
MRSAISVYARLSKTHQLALAAIGAAGVTTLAFAALPGSAAAEVRSAPVKPVAWSAHSFGETQHEALAQHMDTAVQRAKKDAKARTDRAHAEEEAASRSQGRKPVTAKALGSREHAAQLHGWITQSLCVMRAKGIPGTYGGIKRNIMRESSGNPRAINGWDINAIRGIPSKGLLQIIDPTFKRYHVEGTSWDSYDPVANITAACNYAAHRYGSMDNVNSAY